MFGAIIALMVPYPEGFRAENPRKPPVLRDFAVDVRALYPEACTRSAAAVRSIRGLGVLTRQQAGQLGQVPACPAPPQVT